MQTVFRKFAEVKIQHVIVIEVSNMRDITYQENTDNLHLSLLVIRFMRITGRLVVRELPSSSIFHLISKSNYNFIAKN